MHLIDYEMYIDGSFVNSENNRRFESLNPEDNKPWATFPDASENDVERSVQSAKTAFKNDWSKTSVAERAKYLRAIGDKMFENAGEWQYRIQYLKILFYLGIYEIFFLIFTPFYVNN